MNTPSFIKVKDNSYLFANEGTMKFYIPEKYFLNYTLKIYEDNHSKLDIVISKNEG